MITINDRNDFLIELAKMLPEKCCGAELGVLYGDFSEQILKVIKPDFLVLIDPYIQNDEFYSGSLNTTSTAYSTQTDYENLLKRFDAEIKLGRIIVDRKFSYEAVTDYPDNTFDFLYIDSCHKYECVKRDLNDWLPKLKPGGVISGHDFLLLEDFGVIPAVNEFMKENNFEMVLFNESGWDWALKKVA